MATNMMDGSSPLWRSLRWLVWGGAACLLLLPLVAMQFTADVKWTPLDFIVMGTLLGLGCGAYELAVRVARNNAYVVAFGVAAATAFFTIWINLAVGIVGDPGNPVNGLFFAVVAIAIVAAALARLQPMRMAAAMAVTAVAQTIVGLVAFFATSNYPEGYLLSAFFVATWLTSAQLFRMSACRQMR